MVGSDKKGGAKEILAELFSERDYGEQLFPSNVVILLMAIVQLTGVTDGFFCSILDLRKYGSAPMALSEASQSRMNMPSSRGRARTSALVSISFSRVKAVWHSSDHTKWTPFFR